MVGTGLQSDAPVVYDLRSKLQVLFAPTLFYSTLIDLQTFIVMAVLLLVAIFGGALRMAGGIALAVVALTVLAVLLPTWFAGNWGNDFRLMAPIAMLAIGGCRFQPTRRWLGPALAAGVIVVVGARVASLLTLWPAYDKLYGEMVALGDDLEPGARLLPVRHDWQEIAAIAPIPYGRLFYHPPVLPLLAKAVFVPTVFTGESKQIVSATEAYAAIDVPHGTAMPVSLLRRAADPSSHQSLILNERERYDTYAGWPDRFDYVLLMDFGRRENPLPEMLTAVRSGSYFTLYKITAPPIPAGG